MNESSPNLFENSQIDLTELPSFESLEFLPLHKSYFLVSMVNRILLFIMIAITITGFFLLNQHMSFDNSYLLALGIWLLVFVLALVVNGITFKYKGYALRNKDLVYKSGWIWRKTTTIPFNRIQHCELSQGPLEKYLDLSKLNIYTAGGQSSDLKLPGIVTAEAERMKEYLLQQINENSYTNN